MAINQSRQDNPAAAIQFLHLAPVLLEPWIAQHCALRPRRDDLSAGAKHRRIFYYTDFFEGRTAPRRGIAPQGDKLADIGQKEV